jgi:hypothetical protein
VEVGNCTSLDENTAPGKRHPALVADNDVVENIDIEDFAGLAESAGDAFVVAGRFGVSGGVVVGDDDGSGPVAERITKHLAWRDERVVDRADRHGCGGDESVLGVEVQCYRVLAVEILQSGTRMSAAASGLVICGRPSGAPGR